MRGGAEEEKREMTPQESEECSKEAGTPQTRVLPNPLATAAVPQPQPSTSAPTATATAMPTPRATAVLYSACSPLPAAATTRVLEPVYPWDLDEEGARNEPGDDEDDVEEEEEYVHPSLEKRE